MWEKKFKIEIKQQDGVVSVKIENDVSEILEETRKALIRLPLKESINKEDLDYWVGNIYDFLFCRDRNEKVLTDRQVFNSLEELDKLLKKLEVQIKEMPSQVRNLIANSDYLQDTYFHLLPNDYSISKSRFLIGLAKGNSSYLRGIQGKEKPKNEKGKKENLYVNSLSDRLAFIFHTITGNKPRRIFDPIEGEEIGDYFHLVERIFIIGEVKASAEHHARQSVERFDDLWS